MKTYARIQNDVVAELFSTDADISQLFNPVLFWVDVTGQTAIAEGWRYDGASFSAPAAVAGTPAKPTIADLEAQIAVLTAQIAALKAS
jgi:hypothetical protein